MNQAPDSPVVAPVVEGNPSKGNLVGNLEKLVGNLEKLVGNLAVYSIKRENGKR